MQRTILLAAFRFTKMTALSTFKVNFSFWFRISKPKSILEYGFQRFGFGEVLYFNYCTVREDCHATEIPEVTS